jgi:hypothetical protein
MLAAAAAAAVGGALVALHYAHLGLTLSHYDARGHLVVSRRIFDSITPGWQQIGAVWLPLPHLLNALPVQIDAFYRTGASGVAISVASFAIAVGAIAWIVTMLTDSAAAGVAAATVFALNPNVLYLQATPMTEPLLLGLTLLAVALLIAWCEQPRRQALRPFDVAQGRPEPAEGRQPQGRPEHSRGTASAGPTLLADRVRPPSFIVGAAFALACLTRYEAWPVTGAALALAAWARWRGGEPMRPAVRATLQVAAYPAAAIAAFTIFSRIVVGEWFVSGGFFVPENKAQGDVAEVVREIAWGLRALSGAALFAIAAAGAALAAIVAASRKARSSLVLPLALAATAALPGAAFYDGHPFRIRYMVPLVAAEAVCAGLAAGIIKRVAPWAAAVLIVLAVVELHPLDKSAPMVAEAQWDRPNVPVRQTVGRCLVEAYRGETIMASMGSLGHYMQELSSAGFSLRDFLHEGNGDIWLAALNGPRPYAGWLLIEEKAEGGDMLAKIARENPHFLAGFSRTCEGAGVALYRRLPLEADVDSRHVGPASEIDLR